MKRIFSREFWNTPLAEMSTGDARKGMMILFAVLVIACVAVACSAAGNLFYGGC